MKAGMVGEDRVYFPESLLSQLSDLADYHGYKDDGSFLKRSISDQPGVAKAMKAARTAMFGERS